MDGWCIAQVKLNNPSRWNVNTYSRVLQRRQEHFEKNLVRRE